MAALQKAVSPDFTYSQSYLSLLSASGCMAGIICCALPALGAMMAKTCRGRNLRLRHHIKALQLYVSGPTRNTRSNRFTWGTRGTTRRTQPGQGDGQNRSALITGSTGAILGQFSWEVSDQDVKSLVPPDDVERRSQSTANADVIEWPFTGEAVAVKGEMLASPKLK